MAVGAHANDCWSAAPLLTVSHQAGVIGKDFALREINDFSQALLSL